MGIPEESLTRQRQEVKLEHFFARWLRYAFYFAVMFALLFMFYYLWKVSTSPASKEMFRKFGVEYKKTLREAGTGGGDD